MGKRTMGGGAKAQPECSYLGDIYVMCWYFNIHLVDIMQQNDSIKK